MTFILDGGSENPRAVIGRDFQGRRLQWGATNNRSRSVPKAEMEQLFFEGCLHGFCPVCGDAVHSYQLDPTVVPRGAGANLFTVSPAFTGPTLMGVGANCRELPPLFGQPVFTCFGELLPDTPRPPWEAKTAGYDYARYHTSVSGGPYVDEDEVAIDTEADALPDVRGTRRFWPDVYDGTTSTTQLKRGFLLNPDPVWPVPDAMGNPIGRILFRADQIPSLVDFTIAHHNHDCSFQGTISVTVRSYYIGKPLPTLTVAPASPGARRREYVTGQLDVPLTLG